MSISERQFKEMLRGTIHEGKYGTESQQQQTPAEPDQAPAPAPPKPSMIKNGADSTFQQIHAALPWIIAFKVSSRPSVIVLIFIIIGTIAPPVFYIAYGISAALYHVLMFLVGLSNSPLFLFLFVANIVVIGFTIRYLRK